MEKIIPTFYSGYGRYINRFRMIPSDIDCLIPVERRILLILNRFGYSKPIKSYKIDGAVIGELHPHGSIYSTLVSLVRGGLASAGDSNWGGVGLNDCPAAASRYTETRILPWVSKFAFEFINYVPWEVLELESEPLYLPCILPLGLIGDGITVGITFYRTVIPKYSKEDLAKRLRFLLENGKPPKPKSFSGKMSETVYGPCIKPAKDDCEVEEGEKNAFYKILMTGEGSIDYKPHVQLRDVDIKVNRKIQTKRFVSIEGRAPNATFGPLLRAYEKGTLPVSSAPVDQCKKRDVCIYLDLKKGIDPSDFIKNLSDKYLNKTIHFKCYTCDLNGVVHQTPIDDLLLNCFHHWKQSFLKKLVGDVDKINKSILEYYICSFIRDVIKKKNINELNEIIALWPKETNVGIFTVNETYKIQRVKYNVTPEDISKIYTNTPIRRLVEYKKTLEESTKQINDLQNEFDKIDETALNRVIKIVENND